MAQSIWMVTRRCCSRLRLRFWATENFRESKVPVHLFIRFKVGLLCMAGLFMTLYLYLDFSMPNLKNKE
jgi:hypothetical protein